MYWLNVWTQISLYKFGTCVLTPWFIEDLLYCLCICNEGVHLKFMRMCVSVCKYTVSDVSFNCLSVWAD